MRLSKIKSIRKIGSFSKRYDLETEETHNFFANDILVHNSNFSFWYDGTEIKCAKRSGFIQGDDKFYGYQKVLNHHAHRIGEIYAYLKEHKEFSVLVIYGELFGGSYNHPDVPRDAEATSVQKGVFYSPHNDFYGFDIKVDGKYLPVKETEELFQMFGFFYAKTLLEGTLEECLKYPNDFQTKIPEWLGLPPIENNIVEGTVIKPLIPLFENNGSRIILKNKNDKFSEKTGKRPATVRPQIDLTEEGEKYFNDLVEYLNENRLRAVISKIGTITQKEFGKLNGLLIQDALIDFIKENPEFENLDSEQMKKIKKEIQTIGSNLIRPNFANILDGNF